MSEEPDQIALLHQQLSELMKRQESFQREIENLRQEILSLQPRETEPWSAPDFTDAPTDVISSVERKVHQMKEKPGLRIKIPAHLRENPELQSEGLKQVPERKRNLEKFIGENLINKIGIIITIIGVGIGAKYAIDHRFISPLTRIILGYLVGAGLLGFALHLRKQFENFSAVLLSGSMAIFYFITFAAYSFFNLIPISITFLMMVIITVFTVLAAMRYDKQVIAHIGLVGAYAVPFLLSDGSGKVVILFSYMAIINAGILVIALTKYWKSLYYSSFLLTWLIFISWFVLRYHGELHFGLTWIFLSIFFVTFYLILIVNKLMRKEKFVIDDILLLLANSFIFFGIGYSVLRRDLSGEYFLGLFCLGNSLIHGLAGIIINRRKPVDKNLIYLITGLFITFITIALPVQLHGHLITMLWAAEAAVLFWIGRSNKSTICELLTYPVMILAFFSLMIHWPEAYNTIRPMMASFRILFLFNINFLTSLVLIASFSYINIFYFRRPFPSTISESEMFRKIINFILPAMLLTGIYFSFFMEIKCYWNQVAAYGGVGLSENLSDVRVIDGDKYIVAYKVLSVLIYSVVFFSVLSYLNILKFKKRILGLFNLLFNTLVIIFFLTFGLFSLGTLRDNYLLHGLSHYAYPVFMDIGVRYICFLCLGALLYVTYKYMHEDFHGKNFRMEYDLLLHVSILTIASNELINWMDLAGSQSTFKLGLSILFGVYALLLIVLGIWKKKLHLRIGAIVLFSMTLLKLLLYDLTYLNTISKTIVFVILGILLLVISFLYTKYRKVIFEEKN